MLNFTHHTKQMTYHNHTSQFTCDTWYMTNNTWHISFCEVSCFFAGQLEYLMNILPINFFCICIWWAFFHILHNNFWASFSFNICAKCYDSFLTYFCTSICCKFWCQKLTNFPAKISALKIVPMLCYIFTESCTKFENIF